MTAAVRAVYVVLSHRDWPQVQRMTAAILASNPTARVIVMHDARRERFPIRADDPRVEIVDHGLAADWGSWELVEATLRGFERARSRFDAQLVVLVSGQDYPARRLNEWEREALASATWIGDARPLRYRPRWGRRRGEGDDRWTRYAYRWFRSPADIVRPHLPARVRLPAGGRRVWHRARVAAALRLEPLFSVRFVSRGRGVHYGIRRRSAVLAGPDGPRAYWFGAQWVAIPRPLLDHLLDVDLAPGAPLRRLYRRAIIPDESALVTPLAWMTRPAPLPPVTLQRWDVALDRTVTFTIDDLDDVLASGAPFCRKVDPQLSASLMDELDRRIVAP